MPCLNALPIREVHNNFHLPKIRNLKGPSKKKKSFQQNTAAIHILEAIHVISGQQVPEPDPLPGISFHTRPTRFSFENHRVAGNLKHRVLPGKPKDSGTTRYFG